MAKFVNFITTQKSLIEAHNEEQKERRMWAHFHPQGIESKTTTFMFFLHNMRISSDKKFIEEDIIKGINGSARQVGIARTEISALEKANLRDNRMTQDLLKYHFLEKHPEELVLIENYSN